ncbi:MAG: hypothetical protein RL595_441 [Planctomycetota bacterium]|jgi:ferric-dicitrate binding protein FerR (iron transport regulator)
MTPEKNEIDGDAFQDREELYSAYLDGELSDKEARDFEARLASDPEERRRFQQLKETWNLLDYLPAPEVTTNFTARTMDRLEKITRHSTARIPLSDSLPGFAFVAGLVVLFVLGFLGMNAYLRDPNKEMDLVKDLRVVENLPMYQEIKSISFLKRLDEPELFGDEVSGSQGQ